MTVEVDYNGSKGSKLQANLINMNQVPLSAVNDLIARLGPTAAVALLSMQANSPQAVAAGIKISVREFHESCGADDPKRRAGAQAVSAVRHDQHDQQRRR